MHWLLAQLNPIIGDIDANVNVMLGVIEQAEAAGVFGVVFPEMAVSGYPPKDLLLYPAFVQQCLAANQRLTQASKQCLVIWGNIESNASPIGKPLFNAAYCAYQQQIVSIGRKAHLPMYDVFHERRYFEPSAAEKAMAYFTHHGQRIGITICEDLWNHPTLTPQEQQELNPVTYPDSVFTPTPTGSLDWLINLSASPYVQGKPQQRQRLLHRIAKQQQCTLLYTNQVGAQDDVLFDGHSLIVSPDGECTMAPGFIPATLSSQANNMSTVLDVSVEAECFNALTMGIRDYVHKTGFHNVILGLSGGIDSSLTAVLAVNALGEKNVMGIAMPGPYSSDHSLEDAKRLAKTLNIDFTIHSINPLFQSYLHTLSDSRIVGDLAEQNLQARLRGTLLMTLANRHNALVLTTGNKSEIATGYSTLYGDSCGALAPLGDVYKTQVYALCRYWNNEYPERAIPTSVLNKPPSAELAPNQLDQDSLPPYDQLDGILQAFLEAHKDVGEIVALGYDETHVESTVRRVMRNEYKRQQLPPVLKITPLSFGSGRVMPIVQNSSLHTAGNTCHLASIR